MHDVWIAGADMTRVGRLEEPLQDLMAVAAHAALRSADRERPDSIVVATMNPEEFLGDGNFASNVATHMGFANVPVIRVETATSSGAAAFYAGFAQIASGLAHTVVVVGGEKMTHLPTPKVSELIGRSLDPYERSYGTTMPAFAALVTRALMARHGVGERELAQVAVKNHANGARNPLAHFREEITLEMVFASRMVADPLRLYHCCPISDGAAAIVLTAERSPNRSAAPAPTTGSRSWNRDDQARDNQPEPTDRTGAPSGRLGVRSHPGRSGVQRSQGRPGVRSHAGRSGVRGHPGRPGVRCH